MEWRKKLRTNIGAVRPTKWNRHVKRMMMMMMVLPCQSLVDVHRGHKRGSIPPNYVSAMQSITESDTISDNEVWYFGVPMDQALEKEYNKKAKGPGGIIGLRCVAKWNYQA